MDEPRAAQRPHLRPRGDRARSAAAPASSATARACPSAYGVLRSTKSAIASSAASISLARQHDRERRFGVDHRVPRRDVRRGPASIASARRRMQRGQRRGRTAGPRAARASSRAAVDAAGPVGDLDELGELRDPRGAIGIASPRSAPGQPLPSHCSYAAPSASSTSCRQPELGGERARHLRVVVDHVVELAAARDGELEPDPEALQRRVAGARAAASRRARCARRAARGRTCRPSARCRRRTTSPARARRCGSRR